MKKIVAIILVFLCVAKVTSYAGVYGRTDNAGTSGQSGALYGNSTNSAEKDYSPGALFRAPGDNGPGERPGGGGGIGQEAPLGDGLPVLVACCLGLVVVKTFNKRKRIHDPS